MLRSPRKNRVESPESRDPPRYRYFPSGANRAAPEKQANTMQVSMRAEGTMLGFIMIARSRRGPRPSPVRKANPRSIPSLAGLIKQQK